jgi:hypothetical protein
MIDSDCKRENKFFSIQNCMINTQDDILKNCKNLFEDETLDFS